MKQRDAVFDLRLKEQAHQQLYSITLRVRTPFSVQQPEEQDWAELASHIFKEWFLMTNSILRTAQGHFASIRKHLRAAVIR
jgi:hypothetical protein